MWLRLVKIRRRNGIEGARPTGFLARLAKNTAGNVLTIMAASIIPLAGLIGGAVDMSRIYLTKTRLQQACDAGALMGRKVMGGGQWSANSNAANTAALQYFDSNFMSGSYGSGSRTRTFTEANGKVTGNASVTLPMAIMKIFGYGTQTIAVTCDAEMRIPNTDVMFVLDVTGSMDEIIPGDTSRKIDGMNKAVKCFYEILAKENIDDVDCGSGNPSGGVGTQTQIRFGFVPFSTNVNVGKLLPASYFASTWNYQSRLANFNTAEYPVTSTNTTTYWEYYTGSTAPYVSSNSANATGSLTDTQCEEFMQNDNDNMSSLFTPTPESSGGPPPAATTDTEFDDDGNASGGNNGEWGWNGAPDTNGNTRSCRRRRTDTVTQYGSTVQYKFTNWTYKQLPYNVSNFVAGNSVLVATSNNGYVSTPGSYNMIELPAAPGATGMSTTSSTWDGCIEERQTTKATSYDPIPAAAWDLDIDMIPSGTAGTKWGPIWNRLHRSRQDSSGNYTTSDRTNVTNNYGNSSSYACPPEGKLLSQFAGSGGATTFKNYVNTLVPTSNTYHDIGLIWGARLLSPTGIFSSTNATTPGGGAIERHLIFMTDGTAVADDFNQTAYGVAWYDRRQTDSATAPSNATLVDQIHARMAGLCTAIKNKNITLWVIYFGAVSGDDATRMAACATPGKYFAASNNAALITTFNTIAAQISQLRLTQ